ncbi:hypothetical protein Q0O77_14580, partial [Staphylococcus aureus]|nr:hypothetical protein [Staphylococcus aureus]
VHPFVTGRKLHEVAWTARGPMGGSNAAGLSPKVPQQHAHGGGGGGVGVGASIVGPATAGLQRARKAQQPVAAPLTGLPARQAQYTLGAPHTA